jgi:hypothetical protein
MPEASSKFINRGVGYVGSESMMEIGLPRGIRHECRAMPFQADRRRGRGILSANRGKTTSSRFQISSVLIVCWVGGIDSGNALPVSLTMRTTPGIGDRLQRASMSWCPAVDWMCNSQYGDRLSRNYFFTLGRGPFHSNISPTNPV